jgi:ABC-type nitrate/sulfonate/bicarbonate transport system substrate-binding protein
MVSLPDPAGSRSALRLGFVALSDCAPLAVAKETGIFARHGLSVVLSREPGWTAVCGKMFHGKLDAVQSSAGIAFALGLGLAGMRCEVAVPLIFNRHGNAITLSTELDPRRIGQGEGLRDFLKQAWKKRRRLVLAASHRYSSHHILLHSWLERHGLRAPDDVEIIFLPPPTMPGQLRAGRIDGFCVGEPWNSEVVVSGGGWCPATSADLSLGHPEKVLLLSGNLLAERKEEALQLTAALLEACRRCRSEEFRDELIGILALPEYTGASERVLRHSLGARSDSGRRGPRDGPVGEFQAGPPNRPTIEKASWVLAGLRGTGAFPEATCGSLSRIYREDLFHAARQRLTRRGVIA